MNKLNLLLLTLLFIFLFISSSKSHSHHRYDIHAAYQWNNKKYDKCMYKLKDIKDKLEKQFWYIQCNKNNNNKNIIIKYKLNNSFYGQILHASKILHDNDINKQRKNNNNNINNENIAYHLKVHQNIESNNNEKAVSHKGAIGIMQIMPTTGTMETGLVGDELINCLYNKRCNQQVGQKHIQRLKNITNNNLIRILYAYNAGINNENKYWNRNKNLHPIAYIENIPIKETKNYIKKYFTQLWQIQAKYKKNSDSLKNLALGIYPKYPNIL